VRDYLGKKDYKKNDIGNWFYRINLANFSTNFGGVKDEIKIKDRVLIPLD
jgi:hypothetical protein